MNNWIDFVAGALLMNAMPHYVLGVWKAKMLSGFGVGNTKNIVWGLLNAAASLTLFICNYGLSGFADHLFYSGAAFILVTFLCSSWFWQWWFYKRK